MEFSGQYLTYEEYRSLGGTLDLTPFNLLEFEARRKIDSMTMNRLKDIDSQDIPQAVKVCEYNVMNSINSYASTFESANKNIASESTDGYSVSYLNPTQISEVVKSKNAELDDIIENYLFGVVVNGEHILYVGLK